MATTSVSRNKKYDQPLNFSSLSLPEKPRYFVRAKRRDRRLVFRARVILKCVAGQSDSGVAGVLRTTHATVAYWRRRFSEGGVESLWDEPRPGAPRQIGDEKVQKVVELVLQSKPVAATHF
ncbi:MAG TPA: helix-turn-helix domain-containing protein [Verrucomicrobiae bacterium]